MKAMIFAAGLGSRLGDLTQKTAKCLIEVGGKTMLEHVVENLKKAGVSEIMINLFHLGDQIEQFVNKRKGFGLKIEFSKEEVLLGTGGGLKKVETFFSSEQEFLIHNSDIFCQVDLNKVLSLHRKSSAAATLITMERKTSRYLLFDSLGKLVGWEAKEAETLGLPSQVSGSNRLAFAGIHVCSPKIFDYMRDEIGEFSIIKSYFKAAKDGQLIQSFKLTDEYWMDMGKPENLIALQNHLA